MSIEQFRNRQSVSLGPDPASDGATTTEETGNVQVIHGIYMHSQPLGGMTVRRARAELFERLNLDPDAMAVVDGNPVDEDTILAEGQTLNFVKHAGERGSE